MGFNIDDLKKASNEASIAASIKTAADKKKALGESLFTEVIKELKANGVDEKTVLNPRLPVQLTRMKLF